MGIVLRFGRTRSIMPDKPRMPTGFLVKFTVLRGGARELWITFAMKFLIFAAYSVTNLTITLWLSSDFGYSDQQALGLVAAWSILMSVVTLLVGSLTDAIGLRKTFFLGAWVCVAARMVMIFAKVKWLALAGGLFPLAAGEALLTPVLIAAVRIYSNTQQRSISFSILYSVMNAGSLAASYIFDWVRQGLGEHGHLTLPALGVEISSYQALFLVSLILGLLLLPFLWFLREGAEATEDGVRIVPARAKSATAGFWPSLGQTVGSSGRETLRFFAGLLRQPLLHRLLVFLVLIAFLKLILMQMYSVFPKFGIRELGQGAPVGRLWAINALIVIFLAPVIGAYTQRFSAYGVVTLGGALSTASVFIMTLPPAWFQTWAQSGLGRWIGHNYLGLTGAVHPYYIMITCYVVVFSLGESFYSPRVYEYAAAIAPRGQEASYSALSYIPNLLAKLFIGTFSGVLLETYCPEHGVRHSGIMWLFVALTASVAPIGLIALRRFIRIHEAGREN
jgi:dipeptide/tripeptide permease